VYICKPTDGVFQFAKSSARFVLSLSLSLSLSYIYMVLQSFKPWPLFQFLNLYTVGRTSWKGDQPFARPLLTHRTTQTQSKRTDMHASSGIRNHDLSVREDEDGSCLRPRGHCERRAFRSTKKYLQRLYGVKRHIARGF
jgi:hypothetical protein